MNATWCPFTNENSNSNWAYPVKSHKQEGHRAHIQFTKCTTKTGFIYEFLALYYTNFVITMVTVSYWVVINVSVITQWLITPPLVGQWNTVISMSVCQQEYPQNHRSKSSNFLCILPIIVHITYHCGSVFLSCGGVAIVVYIWFCGWCHVCT